MAASYSERAWFIFSICSSSTTWLPLSVVSESGAASDTNTLDASVVLAGMAVALARPPDIPAVLLGCDSITALDLALMDGWALKGFRSVGVKPGVEALA